MSGYWRATSSCRAASAAAYSARLRRISKRLSKPAQHARQRQGGFGGRRWQGGERRLGQRGGWQAQGGGQRGQAFRGLCFGRTRRHLDGEQPGALAVHFG